jgi:hypothetical protein
MERQLGALEQKLDELLAELDRPVEDDAKDVEPDVGNVEGLVAVDVDAGKSLGGAAQTQGQGFRSANSTSNLIGGGDQGKEEVLGGDRKERE